MKLQPISELIKTTAINENKYNLPGGYFLVTNDFKISPGGGWQVSFKKGQLIEYDAATKKCTKYSTENPQGRNVAGASSDVLDISQYGRYPEQEGMLASFQKGTKSIGEKEFEKLKAELGSAIDTVIASLKNYSQDQLKALKAALDKLIK